MRWVADWCCGLFPLPPGAAAGGEPQGVGGAPEGRQLPAAVAAVAAAEAGGSEGGIPGAGTGGAGKGSRSSQNMGRQDDHWSCARRHSESIPVPISEPML